MVMSTVSSMATSDLDNVALGDERRGDAKEHGQRTPSIFNKAKLAIIHTYEVLGKGAFYPYTSTHIYTPCPQYPPPPPRPFPRASPPILIVRLSFAISANIQHHIAYPSHPSMIVTPGRVRRSQR